MWHGYWKCYGMLFRCAFRNKKRLHCFTFGSQMNRNELANSCMPITLFFNVWLFSLFFHVSMNLSDIPLSWTAATFLCSALDFDTNFSSSHYYWFQGQSDTNGVSVWEMSESRERLKSSYERPLCRCAMIYFGDSRAGSSSPTIYNSLLHSLKLKCLRWNLESCVMAGFCEDNNHGTFLKPCLCRLHQDTTKLYVLRGPEINT